MKTMMTGSKTWENPLSGIILDKTGVIQFSGVHGNNSGILGEMPQANIGDNSGNVNSETGEYSGDNENILFLKDELSRENAHDFIVKMLEFFGEQKSLESLKKINKKYKDFHYTTSEIRDLLFETGIFDFVKNWNLKELKRWFYVFKGTYPITRAVLVEIAEKKSAGKDLPADTEHKDNNEKGGV